MGGLACRRFAAPTPRAEGARERAQSAPRSVDGPPRGAPRACCGGGAGGGAGGAGGASPTAPTPTIPDELSTALGAYGKDLDARELNIFTTTDEETAAIHAYWEAHTALTPDDKLPAVLVALSAHIAKRERFERRSAATSTVVPRAYVAEGGGFAPANGTYTRDGDYGGSPKWVHADGQIWLIRYRLPSGSHYWYVADKDQLSRDDGDYYRVKTEAALPPVDGDWRLAKDGVEPPPRFTADVPPTPAESSGNGPVAKLKALIEDQIRARKISAYELIRLASQKGHLFNDGTSARSGDAGMFGQGVGRANRRIRGGSERAEFDFGNGGTRRGLRWWRLWIRRRWWRLQLRRRWWRLWLRRHPPL